MRQLRFYELKIWNPPESKGSQEVTSHWVSKWANFVILRAFVFLFLFVLLKYSHQFGCSREERNAKIGEKSWLTNEIACLVHRSRFLQSDFPYWKSFFSRICNIGFPPLPRFIRNCNNNLAFFDWVCACLLVYVSHTVWCVSGRFGEKAGLACTLACVALSRKLNLRLIRANTQLDVIGE